MALSSLIQWLLSENARLPLASERLDNSRATQTSWDSFAPELGKALQRLSAKSPSADETIRLLKDLTTVLNLNPYHLLIEMLGSIPQSPTSKTNVSISKKFPWGLTGNCCDLKEVKSFISADGDVNAKDEFDRPILHILSEAGNADAIELLLKSGAELEAQDRGGGTALHRAVYSRHFQVARLLLDKGLQLDTADNSGKTALDWAEESDLIHLAMALRHEQRESFFSLLSRSQFGNIKVRRIRKALEKKSKSSEKKSLQDTPDVRLDQVSS